MARLPRFAPHASTTALSCFRCCCSRTGVLVLLGLIVLLIQPTLMVTGWFKHGSRSHHEVHLVHDTTAATSTGAVRLQQLPANSSQKAAGAALQQAPAGATAAQQVNLSTGAGVKARHKSVLGGAKAWTISDKLSVKVKAQQAAVEFSRPMQFKQAIQRLPRNHTVKAVGVVFYGRRSRTRILNCYLERNLVRNGGILREVVFVVATWDQEDIKYLDKLIAAHPHEYRKLHPERWDKGYTGHYAWMDPQTHYFKLDDDVTYIGDSTLDLMMEAYLEHRYFLISANVINHQPLEWPHSLRKAHYNVSRTIAGTWAPHLDTPFFDNGWDVWGSWERAKNVHYSFLYNIRNNRLGMYEFPNNERFFNFNQHFGYTRWRINLITFMGKDIDVHVYNMSSTVETYPGDDEDWITRLLPQQLKKQSAAVSKAIAVHFSFYPQREGLEKHTDLLDQYASLARDICGQLIEPDPAPKQVTK